MASASAPARGPPALAARAGALTGSGSGSLTLSLRLTPLTANSLWALWQLAAQPEALTESDSEPERP